MRPDLENVNLPSTDQPDNTTNEIPPPPGLEQPQPEPTEHPIDHYIHPTAKPDNFKPTRRMTGKQTPLI
eukprot:805428-Amphidinium_carterae.1